MLRICNVLLFGCTAVVVTGWAFEVADAFGVCLIPQQRAVSEAIDLRRRQHDAFMPEFHRILEATGKGTLALPRAARELRATAERLNPLFLSHVYCIDGDGSLDVRLAHRILAHLREDVQGFPPAAPPEVYEKLERQYREMQR